MIKVYCGLNFCFSLSPKDSKWVTDIASESFLPNRELENMKMERKKSQECLCSSPHLNAKVAKDDTAEIQQGHFRDQA